MDQSNNILNLAIEGVRPSKIAAVCNTSISIVTQKIAEAVLDRRVRRTQVLATLDKEWLDQIALYVPAREKKRKTFSPELIHRMLKDSNTDDFDLSIEEIKLYLLCFEKAFKDGDLYESLCEIERTLHTKIRMILIAKYGAQETGWWRNGVPKNVRLECVERRENDNDFADNSPFSYTMLSDLRAIIEYRSPLFQDRLPAGANGKNPNMLTVSSDLTKLNKIRNRVMHPIGAIPPTEEDFFFVKQMQTKFDPTKWR